MDEKQITPESIGEKGPEIEGRFEEPTYIIPPHPEVAAPQNRETASPGEPIAAEESVAALIQRAVDELRAELKEELEEQVRELQTDLRSELQLELQKEPKGGLELNAKG